MPQKTVIRTPNAPEPVGPYNQAIAASGQMLFVAGQIPLDPKTGEVVGKDDIAKQTKQAMDNLSAIVEAAGATLDQVVKTTIFLENLNDFATMNQVYAQYFPEDIAPARACVEVSRLPKGVLVEVECIAMLGV